MEMDHIPGGMNIWSKQSLKEQLCSRNSVSDLIRSLEAQVILGLKRTKWREIGAVLRDEELDSYR